MSRTTTAGVATALAYSWWASGHETFTTGATIAVSVPIAVLVAVVAATWRRHHPRTVADAVAPPPPRVAVRYFALVVAFLVAWELRELFASPRADYPTVSSLVDAVIAVRPLHFAAFLGWLTLGYLLIRPARGGAVA